MRLYAREVLLAIERSTERTWEDIAASLGGSGPGLLRKLRAPEPNLSSALFYKTIRAAELSFAGTTTPKELLGKFAQARSAKGMTLEAVAEQSGRSAWTVGRILSGHQSPRLGTLLILCAVLDVPPTVS